MERRRSRSNASRKSIQMRRLTEGKISRNPFINFLAEFRRNEKGIKPNEVMIRGAQLWRQMSASDKCHYYRLAKQAPPTVYKLRRKGGRRKKSKRRRSRSTRKRGKSKRRRHHDEYFTSTDDEGYRHHRQRRRYHTHRNRSSRNEDKQEDHTDNVKNEPDDDNQNLCYSEVCNNETCLRQPANYEDIRRDYI